MDRPSVLPRLVAVWFLVLVFPVHAAPFTDEGLLIGNWQSAAGDRSLFLLPSRGAILTVGDPNDPKTLEPRFGGYKPLRRGIWWLTVRNLDHYESAYSMVLSNRDTLILSDTSGGSLTLSRIVVRFEDYDRNGDGFVTEEEVKTSRLRTIFKEFDTNSDSRVDLVEFRSYWTRIAR